MSITPSSASELEEMFSPDGDGEYPAYTRQEWREAVASQTTLLGYWQWVREMLWEEAL